MMDNIIYLIGQFVNTVGQIILFSSIPFIWYFISKKKFKGVFEYLGLKKSNKENYIQALKITILAYIFSFSTIFISKLIYEDMSLNPIADSHDRGFIVFTISLVLLGIKTGVSEEILFRGFLGKRLICKFGLLKGNLFQTGIFMILHVSTFGKSPTLEFILGLINAAIIGFTFGYIMDKKSNGSILPVIICHGIVNVTSAILINII